MTYLVDTNVVSELRRVRPHGAVLAWFSAVDHSQIHLSAVTIGEIQAGIEATRESDREKAASLERWLDGIVADYNVLPVDAGAFRVFARLIHGKSEDLLMDAMIAATAQTRNLVVVTRDTADFDTFGVESLNPFLHPRT